MEATAAVAAAALLLRSILTARRAMACFQLLPISFLVHRSRLSKSWSSIRGQEEPSWERVLELEGARALPVLLSLILLLVVMMMTNGWPGTSQF